MLFIFSTSVLIRHLWQLKTIVFLHECLIHIVQLQDAIAQVIYYKKTYNNLKGYRVGLKIYNCNF
jgi:hypothetical protein